MHKQSKMVQFITRYPQLDYGQLDGTLKAISRLTKASPDTLLAVALVDRDCAAYLVKTVMKFQDQIEAAVAS